MASSMPFANEVHIFEVDTSQTSRMYSETRSSSPSEPAMTDLETVRHDFSIFEYAWDSSVVLLSTPTKSTIHWSVTSPRSLDTTCGLMSVKSSAFCPEPRRAEAEPMMENANAMQRIIKLYRSIGFYSELDVVLASILSQNGL